MIQPQTQVSDADLIQSYKAGNTRAIEMLVMRHKDKMYTAILMLVKDHFVAEDIFQDTFLKIIRTIQKGRYREEGKFLPWALRVARNLCMDHFRKIRRDIPIITEDGQELFQLLSFATESPEAKLERSEVQKTVRQLIETLPIEQREVIVLRIYGELSFKEIASITSVSINTALGRMRYGLLNLRKRIVAGQLVLR